MSSCDRLSEPDLLRAAEALLAHVPEDALVARWFERVPRKTWQTPSWRRPRRLQMEVRKKSSPERWAIGEDFEDAFNALLTAYYAAINTRLATQPGFDYFQLAESRRRRVRETMPIFSRHCSS